MNACAAPPLSNGFLGSVTSFIDCQAEMLGSGAYQALGVPGSTLSVVLGGFLTAVIALIGYRLLLGDNLTLREGTLAMVKIGAVFALATSWPAYRTLVYDIVTDGPAEVVSDIGPAAAIPDSAGSLVRRLDAADGALVQLAIVGVGVLPSEAQQAAIAPPPFTGFNAFALGVSRILFLLTALAGLGVVRIIAALMLALGPLFIAFLLFDSTRSLFEGWVRVLGGAAIGAIGVAIALGLQLALLEPWLAAILARRAAGEVLPSVPAELVVVTALFAIVVLAVIIACGMLARAFRLGWLGQLARTAESARPASAGSTTQVMRRAPALGEERSRAVAVAEVMAAVERREIGGRVMAGPRMALAGPAQAAQQGSYSSGGAARAVPLGRSFRRRPGSRASASADRRDKVR